MNQRAVKIHKIRQELKSLKRQHKAASEELRPPTGRVAGHLEEEADDCTQCRMASKAPEGESQKVGFIHRQSLWLHQNAAGEEAG